MLKHIEKKEQKIVVAIAENCEFDAINKIVKRHPYINEVNMWDFSGLTPKLNFGLEYALMPNTFSAVARCHEEDEYSFEEGKKVADAKLLMKLETSQEKAIKAWKKHQTKILDVVDLSYHKKNK